MRDDDAFAAAYSDALHGFLLVGGEGQLAAAYELGRRAVAEEVSVLELSDAHHEALLAVVSGDGMTDQQLCAAIAGGRDFLREALSAYEMVQRGFREARERALAAGRDAAVLRRLTELLARRPAGDDAGWTREVAQLVAEQALQLCRADAALVTVDHPGHVVAVEHDPGRTDWRPLLEDRALRERGCATGAVVRLDGAGLAADPLLQRIAGESPAARVLSGSMLVPLGEGAGRAGALQLFVAGGRAFSDLDEEVARHLALLATGALERRDRGPEQG